MKKYILLIACVCALLALTACGEKPKTIDSETERNTSVTFTVDDDTNTEEGDSDNTSAEPEDDNKTESTAESNESSEKATSSKSVSSKKTSSKTTSSKTTSSKAVSSAVSSQEVSSAVSSEEEVSSLDTESEEVESSTPLSDVNVIGKWTATKITDSYGERIDGEQIYGTAYRQYGGSVEFTADGTFCLRMGVSPDDMSNEGTYTYDGGDKLTMLAYDDTLMNCSFEELNGIITFEMPISLFGDEFTVYFVRK